jgi:hypothetical protein
LGYNTDDAENEIMQRAKKRGEFEKKKNLKTSKKLKRE